MVQLERITHTTKDKGRPYLVPAFWHRLGRAMCPRAVWCPGIVQGVPCVRVPFWCRGIVQGVQLATARTPPPVRSLFMYPRPCVIEAPKYHRFSELEKV